MNRKFLILILLLPYFCLADVALNTMAPHFELNDQYSHTHKLTDYGGKWLILYFYPKDDTPGCTKEACNFRDDIIKIHSLGAEVLGVSVDNTESHAKFAEEHGLPFPLLSDGDGKIAKEYGSLWSIGPIKFARRHSFIINPAGNIAKIYRDVDPDNHSNEVIYDLKDLQKDNLNHN